MTMSSFLSLVFECPQMSQVRDVRDGRREVRGGGSCLLFQLFEWTGGCQLLKRIGAMCICVCTCDGVGESVSGWLWQW